MTNLIASLPDGSHCGHPVTRESLPVVRERLALAFADLGDVTWFCTDDPRDLHREGT